MVFSGGGLRADGRTVAGDFSDHPAGPFELGEVVLSTGSAPPAGQLRGPWEGVVARSAR